MCQIYNLDTSVAVFGMHASHYVVSVQTLLDFVFIQPFFKQDSHTGIRDHFFEGDLTKSPIDKQLTKTVKLIQVVHI